MKKKKEYDKKIKTIVTTQVFLLLDFAFFYLHQSLITKKIVTKNL